MNKASRLIVPVSKVKPKDEGEIMKLITAIIKPEKLDEMIETVIGTGAHGMTVTEVRGFGRQYGHTLAAMEGTLGLAVGRRTALLPKVRLDLVVPDEDAEALVGAIAKQACTETIGDGKIWVSTVDSAMRVRTGERDREAL